MNRDVKKNLIVVREVYPEIVQVQVEDYCAEFYKVIITNTDFEYVEKDEDEE